MTDLEKLALIAIRRGEARSRAELARRLNISRPTASAVAERLLSAGRIREAGRGISSGGKAPTMLTVVPECFYLLGFDLGYTDRLQGVLTDAAGTVIRSQETAFSSESPADAVRAVGRLAKQLGNGLEIGGAAAAVSGVADGSGRILSSINQAYQGDGFLRDLKQKLKMPVLIENRPRMAAVAEAFGGAAEGEKDFALISLGKSIGSAFHLHGELYTGVHFSSGEIRRLPLGCGLTLEHAMTSAAIQENGLAKTAELCAEGLNHLVAVIGLDLLVLAGRFADYGKTFAGLLEAALDPAYECRVRLARFGRECAARGAAFHLGEMLIRQS